jgi:hypothetical protein
MSRIRRISTIRNTVRSRLTPISAAAAVAVVTLAAVALWPREAGLRAEDATAVAIGWVGTGRPQPPRCDGDECEVDVTRPDGSLVEVTVGKNGELIGFDEERGPGGGPAPDELRGMDRARAVRAALAAVGPGRVLGTERDHGGGAEIDVRRSDGTQVEIELDHRLRIREVEPEHPADE